MLPQTLAKWSIALTLVVLACGASPDDPENDGAGSATQVGAICPTVEPSTGAACDASFACAYPACQRANASVWSCERGAWKHVVIPGCQPAL